MAVLETQRRTQAERRDEAERKLLDAAVRLVAERGLERVTLADIGEAAGYSRGLPAHYFGSKAGLIIRLAQHLVDAFIQDLAKVEHHPLGLDRLTGIIRFYFDAARKAPPSTKALFVLFGDGLNSDLVGTQLAALNARVVKEIEANIVAGVKSRMIRSGIDTKAQATLILSTLRGAVGQWLLSPRTIDIVRLRDEMVVSLTRSLVP